MANNQFLPYETLGGETWPLVAYRAYGDQFQAKTITDANPLLKIYDVLPAGLVLNIPIITAPASTVDPALLPSWKQ